GERRELWFRFGRPDGSAVGDPAPRLAPPLRGLATRVPRAAAPAAPEAALEIPWHAALLTGGLAVDRVVGGHPLDQGAPLSLRGGLQRRGARPAPARAAARLHRAGRGALRAAQHVRVGEARRRSALRPRRPQAPH